MKNKNHIILGALIVVMAMFLVGTTVKKSYQFSFAHRADEIHKELVKKDYFISPNAVDEKIKAGTSVIIDIRDSRSYANGHVEGAINVPKARVLDDDHKKLFKDEKEKILYCSNSVMANQVRLLLTQYGYQNIKVMQGGMDAYQESVINKNVFKEVEFDDEKALEDYAKVMKDISGGEVMMEESGAETANKPVIKKKKKTVAGGCS